MNFRLLIQRNKDMATVFGALSEKVESLKKAFWMCIYESHHRPAVQHLRFVLLGAENNRVRLLSLYCWIPCGHHSIFSR